MTLPELLVAVTIGSLMLLASLSLMQFSGRSFAALINYVELDNDSRRALDTMTRDIRQSDSLSYYHPHQIMLNHTNNVPLTYTYHPEHKTVSRLYMSQRDVLLTGCEFFKFSIFKRIPVEGTYDVYPTADITTCKMIQLDWTCSRTVLGIQPNTETVQSAKIVIRRQ